MSRTSEDPFEMGQKNKRVEVMMRDKKPSNQSPLAQCFEFIIPFEKVFHRSTTLLIDSSSTTHWGKNNFLVHKFNFRKIVNVIF